MDYTFKLPSGSAYMPTKIPQVTRETNPTVSMVSTHPPNFCAPPTNSATPSTNAGLNRAPHSLPPHIMIHPWDGSSWSRQEFTNQLLAQTYFHPRETRNDREKMIWAISHFQRYAADEAGDFMARLAGGHGHLDDSFVGDTGPKIRGVRAVWTPDTWEKFLYLYLEDVEAKVARRRELWIVKALRAFGTWVFMILWLLMWCAVVILGAGLLIEFGGMVAENSDAFWTLTRGRVITTV